ncbi:MAG: hypothetical protein HY736_14495 [Verrucomicrobia bacterium]|nr:hypothetical protein [Verrucomicrobiota bacterium]
MKRSPFLFLGLLAGLPAASADPAPFEISGIYPHLAHFNGENECGTGAVVPWADRLWVITYAPHKPKGSTDKLYEIDAALNRTVRPESVGGTPANRFIHRETQQLFIDPYIIDAQRNVRVIPPDKMYGRLTGNARHLTDPANKIYYATMEEGFYEVDVRTLAVTELFRDEQLPEGRKANLPGYHGKGLYSGQGVLVYANNGEHGKDALTRPDIPSGALAAWNGASDKWAVVRRNQFTEVTGPGGLHGNDNPASDPIWSIGWDHRSLILMVLDAGRWHAYRLPKASHSYDGAHGWNTEWPRIRDIGEKDLLMTMHGAFWRFPRDFAPAKSAGVAPRSNYLKVIGDFARWNDRVVMGCDDTALSEFLNKRRAKGKLAAPGQSQSNLWSVEPALLERLGPPIGRGAVWLDEPVKKDEPSDAFLFSGFDQRMLHLAHDAGVAVTFALEIDRAGNNQWSELRRVAVPASGYAWTSFAAAETGAWIRVRPSRDCAKTTAFFSARGADRRPMQADARFDGLLRDGAKPASGGLLHARGDGRQTLEFAAARIVGEKTEPAAYYELGADMKLGRKDEPAALAWMVANVAIPVDAVAVDAASVVYTDEKGQRFRLPKGRADFTAAGPLGAERTLREVCTERDLLNCAGTFFEVPAENAGGIAKIRPVATHNRRIHDFASWRGLLVLSGVAADAPATNRHIIRSDDGRVAVWVGAVDDLWSFGKPVGEGGPWKDTAVAAGQPSDPYLMTGYDHKKLTLSHRSPWSVRMRVEVDFTGTGRWVTNAVVDVPAGKAVDQRFPDGYQAYWVRVSADVGTTATAWLTYD